MSVPVMRLPRALRWNERIAYAGKWLDGYKPDWISLQFVPFAFQPKGLPWRLPDQLVQIAAGRHWHVMMHELWLGLSASHSVKEKIWGCVQRRIILKMMHTLQPEVVHTSNVLYRGALAKYGIACEILPLFSNIAVAPPTCWALHELASIEDLATNRSGWLILGVFGAVRQAWLIEAGPWLRDVAQMAQAKRRRVLIVGIGKISPADKRRFEELSLNCSDCAKFKHLGAHNSENVSSFLQAIDAGISTEEKSHMGKSGAVAAFNEHGLPVLLVRTDDQPDRKQARGESLQAVEALLNDLPPHRPRCAKSGLESVATQFITALH
jgi:ribosomal protein S16